MKRIWNVFAVLAIANLLAIGGFVGWLGATDRLSVERLRSLREILKPTVAEQSAQEARLSTEAAAKTKADAEATRRSGTPESSDQRIEDRRQTQDVLDQQLVRMKEEARQIKEQIQAKQADLERQAAALDAARKEFDQRQAEWKQLAQDENFQQAVGVLEAQKPVDAMKVLTAILDGAPLPQTADSSAPQKNKREIVIRYLAAMADRTRARSSPNSSRPTTSWQRTCLKTCGSAAPKPPPRPPQPHENTPNHAGPPRLPGFEPRQQAGTHPPYCAVQGAKAAVARAGKTRLQGAPSGRAQGR